YVGPFTIPGTPSSSEATVQVALQADGSITNFQAFVRSPPGTGKSWTFTVNANGVPTTVTCTIADTDNSCADTSDTATFTSAASIAVRTAPAHTPAATQIGWTANSS